MTLTVARIWRNRRRADRDAGRRLTTDQRRIADMFGVPYSLISRHPSGRSYR